jgi:tRNA(Ile)-lysidine synthase
VTFSPAILADQLKALETVAGKAQRFIIAFSGGLDSTALLHALATLRRSEPQYQGIPVVAIHVDHGLQADSRAWRDHCAQIAAEFELDFHSLVVTVETDSGYGPEASARDARYAALHAALKSGDWLLSAHHRDDQAETLMLNLIRGSGPAGVAGIGDVRRFGPGWLVRPMLNVERADILDYATRHDLRWVEDPSNADLRFDRNFLRHEILPRLAARWPDIAVRLQRSAGHAGEASRLLVELAELDLAALGSRSERLPIDQLLELSKGRQRNVIRYALRDLGLSTPTAVQLERVLEELIPARADAQPLVSWAGASVRRYRNGLYLLPLHLAETIEAADIVGADHELGAGLGRLQLVPGAEVGVSQALVDAGLSIRPREGGEEIQLSGQTHTRKLKKLLQEQGVVPWMRDRLPLLYAGEQLVAVADLWTAAEAVTKPGVAVRWIGRPALH